MKKICTFTLEGDDYPSKDYRDKLRLFAFMLYDFVYNYYGEGIVPLNINRNIVYNNLHCEKMDGGYFFDSEVFDNGYINYEPFLIGKHSFGLTLCDDLISERELMNLVGQVLYMLKIDKKVTLRTVEYYSKDADDEKNRRKAIFTAYGNLGCEPPQRKLIFSIKKAISGDKCVVPVKYPEFRPGFSRKKVLNNCHSGVAGMAVLER